MRYDALGPPFAHSRRFCACWLLFCCTSAQASLATAMAPLSRPLRLTATLMAASLATATARRPRRPPLTGTRTAASPATVTAALLPPPLPTCALPARRAVPTSPCRDARDARTRCIARATARRRTGRKATHAHTLTHWCAPLCVATPVACDVDFASSISLRCCVAGSAFPSVQEHKKSCTA